jgi:hypothetical protein
MFMQSVYAYEPSLPCFRKSLLASSSADVGLPAAKQIRSERDTLPRVKGDFIWGGDQQLSACSTSTRRHRSKPYRRNVPRRQSPLPVAIHSGRGCDRGRTCRPWRIAVDARGRLVARSFRAGCCSDLSGSRGQSEIRLSWVRPSANEGRPPVSGATRMTRTGHLTPTPGESLPVPILEAVLAIRRRSARALACTHAGLAHGRSQRHDRRI